MPITYVEADGTEKTVDAEIGKNLMDVAHDNDVELEGMYGLEEKIMLAAHSIVARRFSLLPVFVFVIPGACGGELACSTCHLVFEQSIYDTLPEKEEEEDDMLDLAFEVTET